MARRSPKNLPSSCCRCRPPRWPKPLPALRAISGPMPRAIDKGELQLTAARRKIVAGALASLAEGVTRCLPMMSGAGLRSLLRLCRDENSGPSFRRPRRDRRSQGNAACCWPSSPTAPPSLQRGKIDRFDLARRFDHIQIEGEHGFGKPEERAYTGTLCRALGVEAARDLDGGRQSRMGSRSAAAARHPCDLVRRPVGAGLPPGSPVRPDTASSRSFVRASPSRRELGRLVRERLRLGRHAKLSPMLEL